MLAEGVLAPNQIDAVFIAHIRNAPSFHFFVGGDTQEFFEQAYLKDVWRRRHVPRPCAGPPSRPYIRPCADASEWGHGGDTRYHSRVSTGEAKVAEEMAWDSSFLL